jgi:hypothetical protein
MPIKRCAMSDGSQGYKFGDKGHCYKSRKDAVKQAGAMFANGYKGKGSEELELIQEAEQEFSKLSDLQKRLLYLIANCKNCQD